MDTHSSKGIADDPLGRRSWFFTIMSLKEYSFFNKGMRLLLSTEIISKIR